MKGCPHTPRKQPTFRDYYRCDGVFRAMGAGASASTEQRTAPGAQHVATAQAGQDDFDDDDDDEFDGSLRCPITQEIMRDPVICADGHSYDRHAIEEWFRMHKKHATSPLTNERLTHKNLVPNHALRSVIAERRETVILRDPYTNKPFVNFYATKRVGGCVSNSEAIKLLKFAAS